jgi:type IV secretory pathway component VirB8
MSIVERLSSFLPARDGHPPAPQSGPRVQYDTDAAPLQQDELGAYLMRHDTPQSAERHSSAVSKLAIAALGLSLSVNAVLSVVILQMFPLYRVVPFFVTFSDRADSVVTINPPKANLTSLAILTEENVRTYVRSRHAISADPQETYNRWSGVVRAMSTPEVYSGFLTETKPIYDSITQKKFTRTISIKSVNETSPGFFRIEFEAIDRRIGEGLTDSGEDHRTFISELRYVNAAQAVRYEDRFLNPLGFTVVNYSVAAKK